MALLILCFSVTTVHARNLVWKGGISSNTWDAGITANWLVSGTTTPTVTYIQGDAVLFDSTGSTTPALTLNGSLSPASVQVTSSGNYTFGGSGVLGGNMTLVKSDNGTLTISPVSLSANTTTSNASSTATVASASGLVVGMQASGSGITPGTAIASISGNTITLSQNATATATGIPVTYYCDHTYAGTNTLNGGTLALGGFQQSGIGGGAIILQGGTLALNGISTSSDCGTFSNSIGVPAGKSGTLKIMQRGTVDSAVSGTPTSTLNVVVTYIRGAITGDWSAFAGQINVTTGSSGSEFRICNTNGLGNATINLGAGVIMDQGINPPNDGLDAGTTQLIGMLTGSGTLAGQPVAGRVVNWQVGGNNASGTFSGVIQDSTGAARVTKEGSGTWTMANPCTYSGSTTVNAGTLIVNGLPNSSSVSVASGATLGGSGTIAGPVNLQFNASLQTGNSLVFAGGINLAQPDGSSLTVNFGTTGNTFGVLNPLQLSGGNITTSGAVDLQVNVQSGTFVPGTYVLATGATTGSGTAQVYLSGLPKGYVASLDATSQPGKLLLVVYPVAFPGAEGYGATATGGRGGSVYHVTNLNDAGAGSFRDAVSQPNRTVVFDVGGIINLATEVEVQDNITIAGQTAPGQGISTLGNPVYLNHGFGSATSYGHSNIIIRHMRFRQGYNATDQSYSLALKPAHTVIIDHCSVEIGNWQTFSITFNDVTGELPTDITVQKSIIGASVSNQLGVLDWNPVNLTWHHNLFIDNSGRDPKAEGNLQIINDVVYNYQMGVYGNGAEQCDFIGNYHIAGPDSNGLTTNAGVRATAGYYYISGNYWDKTRDGALNGSPFTTTSTTDFTPTFVAAPQNNPQVPVTVDTALLSYYKVVSEAGTSLSRDALDSALIDQILSLGTQGPGGTAGASYVPGMYMKHVAVTDPLTGNPLPYWTITGGTAPTDTDRDGMPDDWEIATGSNPAVADGNTVLADGYTRLEHYLNWMAEPHLRLANNATATIDLVPFFDAFPAATSTFAVSGAVNGVAVLMPDGHSVQFSPGAGFVGLASFDFTATAQDGTTMTRTLGILGTPPKSLVWKGDGTANAWDTTTANWLKQSASSAYGNADSVTFDDTGSAAPSINLPLMQAPGAVTFNSITKSYTLGGNGSLAGNMVLTKSGAGNLTVTTANDYSGGTMLNAGILALGNSTGTQQGGAPGAGAACTSLGTGVLHLNGGQLQLGGKSGATVYTYIIGTPVIVNGGGIRSLDGQQQFNGGLLVDSGGASLMTAWSGKNIYIHSAWSGSGNCTIDDLNAGGTDSSRGLVRVDSAANSFNGTITINGTSTGFHGGCLQIENDTALAKATIVNKNTAATALLFTTAAPQLGAIGGAGNLTISSRTLTVGGNGANSTFSGSWSGNGTLVKTGSGTMTMSGISSPSGNLTVSAGQIALTGNLTTAGSVVVSTGATLSVSGNLTVSGSLSNSGTLRLLGGSMLKSTGTFTNNGTLDAMTGQQALPSNLLNSGTVLDASVIKIKQYSLVGTSFTAGIQSYVGHNYQLQKAPTLLAPVQWTNVGTAQAGTGAVLTFSDPAATGTQSFYRIQVSP